MPTAELGQVRLHYEMDGTADKPVLVFSNSIGSSLSMWDRVLSDLADRFRILRYDTRGHGASSVPPGPYTMADLGNDVVGLLDLLTIGRCIFCGLSLGGMTGIWLAANEPRRVEKLILANTGARIGTREGWNDRIAAVKQGGMEAIAGAILGRWLTPAFRQASPETAATVRRMVSATSAEGYSNCCAAIRDADLTPALSRITAPSLIIAGTEDPATPTSDGRMLAEGISNSAYVELKTAHLSAVEDPRAFSEAILEFLGRTEA